MAANGYKDYNQSLEKIVLQNLENAELVAGKVGSHA